MRKRPITAAENLLEIIMHRYERASTILTSNRPVDDWGKLLGDSAAVTAMLDPLLHHAHVVKLGPRSWRTKGRNQLSPNTNRAKQTPVSKPRPLAVFTRPRLAGFEVSTEGKTTD